jgi:hypothetical protein
MSDEFCHTVSSETKRYPMTDSPSTVAKPLISVAQVIWQAISPHLQRVYKERQAGQKPPRDSSDLLGQSVDETLARLRGGNIDDT